MGYWHAVSPVLGVEELTQSVLGSREGGGDPCPGRLSTCLFEQLGCLLSRYPLVALKFVVTHGKYNVLGRFPAAVSVLFAVLEAGSHPQTMACFWIVGGGLEVFELSDCK